MLPEGFSNLMMIIVVYWYLFSNHYTLECIHTGEKKKKASPNVSGKPLGLPVSL